VANRFGGHVWRSFGICINIETSSNRPNFPSLSDGFLEDDTLLMDKPYLSSHLEHTNFGRPANEDFRKGKKNNKSNGLSAKGNGNTHSAGIFAMVQYIHEWTTVVASFDK
jgi:hypothetical protein